MVYRMINKYTGNVSFKFNSELELIKFLKENATNEFIEDFFNLDDYSIEKFNAETWKWYEI